MHRILSILASSLLIALIGGCSSGAVEPCREFDPPPNHQPESCPPKPVADKSGIPKPARYCYRSLAQVDCYSEPQPGRTGYLGSTETSSPPPEPAAPPAAGPAPAPAATTTAPATQAAPVQATPAPSQPVKLAPAS